MTLHTTGGGDDDVDLHQPTQGVSLASILAGDDTLMVTTALTSASATSAGDILVGGDGTDTFSVTSALANGQVTYTGKSGFEVVDF